MTMRDAARDKGCPKCGVGPGWACIGSRGPRVAYHIERHRGQMRTSVPSVPRKTKTLRTKKDQRVGFYWSREWRELRYEVIRQHGGCCQCCGARPSAGRPLHVDHIKPRSKFPALELEAGNLQVLCADCNLGKGAHDQTDWRAA